MYAAAGGASLAGRKARLNRHPAPNAANAPPPPVHPARAYSCSHWESLIRRPPPTQQPLIGPIEEHSEAECAQGRAAWQEAAATYNAAVGTARRCSVQGDHPKAKVDHRKWPRKNRIRDALYDSDSEVESDWDEKGGGEAPAAATLLYAGLGTLAIGLVVYFVGTGDKGFRTPALRMVGPTLVAGGLACCILRIILCICARPCCRCSRSAGRKDTRSPLMREEVGLADHTRTVRAGPAQCSPARRSIVPGGCDLTSLSSTEEEEHLRQYRISAQPLIVAPQNQPAELLLSAAQLHT